MSMAGQYIFPAWEQEGESFFVILGAGFTQKGLEEGRNTGMFVSYRTGDLQRGAWVQGNMSAPHGREKPQAPPPQHNTGIKPKDGK